MTSFAFILGVTLFGIFLTPVFYSVLMARTRSAESPNAEVQTESKLPEPA